MDYQELSEELLDLQVSCAGALNLVTSSALVRGEDSLLLWLSRQDTAVFPTDIMRHFRISSGRVANMLKSAQQKGLILRYQNGGDLRKNCIMITEEGREFARTRKEQVLHAQTQLLQGLTEEDAAGLVRVFSQILRNAG